MWYLAHLLLPYCQPKSTIPTPSVAAVFVSFVGALSFFSADATVRIGDQIAEELPIPKPLTRIKGAMMTIRIPPENILDRILRRLGKERQILIPQEAVRICNELGPYVQIKAKRESFISALFRIQKHSEDWNEQDFAGVWE